jgi:CHAT domain-containing protein
MKRTILFLASSPTDAARLRLDREFRDVEEGLRRSNERQHFELVPKFAVRAEDLRRSLLDHAPSIVHFSGHGDGPGGILIEDSTGLAVPVPNDALARLLELCAAHVECVVLNACLSEVQADLIAKHIPYVIGMTDEVDDDAAIEFAVGFYDALGAGRSIEEAFEFGRNAIATRSLPGEHVPVLKSKPMTPADRERLVSARRPTGGTFVELSVLNADASNWKRGEDTELRYTIERHDRRLKIVPELGYFSAFRGGGPIRPLSYNTPMYCAFHWDLPVLDFKILNNGTETLFLTEVVFDIDESKPDLTPFFAIQRDVQQRQAFHLLLANEGPDLCNLTIAFNLLPGELADPPFTPPYRHSIELPELKDAAQVEIVDPFHDQGVDFEGLELLYQGEWRSREAFEIPTADGGKEEISAAEVETRFRKCLGPFSAGVSTLAGEISFPDPSQSGDRHSVRFFAHVYLENKNRVGLPKPPSYAYGTAFEVNRSSYQRRVQISHELKPGETERFTVKIAVAQSSVHKFRSTLKDITGEALDSTQVEMRCFVPRRRQKAVETAIARAAEQKADSSG